MKGKIVAALAAGAFVTALFATPAQAVGSAPEGECFIFCETPKKGLYNKGCQFFCDLGKPPKRIEKVKNPGHHGGLEWGPTKRGECTIFCGEGYRQRKYKNPGPLFPDLGF